METEIVAAKIWSESIMIKDSKIRQRLTWEELNKVEAYRRNAHSTYKFSDFLSNNEANAIVGVPDDIDTQIESLQKKIEISQMALFRFFKDTESADKQRELIAGYRKEILSLANIKSSAAKYTLDGKVSELVEHYKFRLRGGSDEIYNVYYNSMPTLSEIRAAVKTTWFSTQLKYIDIDTNIGPLTQWQTTCLIYYNLYKDCSELEDFPKHEIVEDDDAFDGWLLSRKNKKGDNNLNKHLGSANVYQFAGSQEEATQNYLRDGIPEALKAKI